MTLLAIITYATLTAITIGLVWILVSTIKMIVTDLKEGN